MAYGFLDFWLYIIIDIVVLIVGGGYFLWFTYFDVRLRVYLVYPNKQIRLYRRKIKNDLIEIYDDNTKSHKLYTVNKDFIYFRNGRIPFAYYWDNIPIPIDLAEKLKFSDEEILLIKKINSKYPIQINIHKPNTKFKKDIEIDTAETLFRVLHTNFTLNLLKPPTEFRKAVKWTIILIIVSVGLAIILHFMGVIDLMELLGGATTT